ncbi:hypothetical protein [Formosa sp. S-31]|uniref:hypothetical protein n=1 Tax=Formosa sp. S-31 TaxID=2790949 RepID=UPI003EBAF229
MKKVLKLSLGLLVMITSMTTSYADNVATKGDEKGKMEVTLTLENVKAGQQVLIKDVSGVTIYKEAIQEAGLYHNTFDLKALPEGDYYFEHLKDFQIKLIPFTVKNETVTVNKANEKVFFKPALRKENNMLYLTQLALDKKDLKVSIYYSNNFNAEDELVLSETIRDTVNIERIYGLSANKKGEYKVVLSTNGEEFVEYVKL